MHDQLMTNDDCATRAAPAPRRRERGIQSVMLLTAAMMMLELVVGYATNSMALLADGWHMATHVGALGLASAAYWVSRRFAGHRAFTFGTGKVRALAGYTSAVALAFVAIAMMAESVNRLRSPAVIDFVSSLPVAVLGLVVNIASVLLLHVHDDDGTDEHDHDHNHHAALLHVVADTFTSGLAIVALLTGRFLGWGWFDAVAGIVSGLVILKWGTSLVRSTSFELLDVSFSTTLEDEIRSELEALNDVRVRDLHVWSLGGGKKSCVVTLVTAAPQDTRCYRQALARFALAHLTIEVQRCEEGHGQVALR